MTFDILMGVPDMKKYWDDLCKRAETNTLGNQKQIFKKLVKTLSLLSNNPSHNSLSTPEIKPLSARYGMKIWQSYLENNMAAAGRIFRTYEPATQQSTMLAIEQHL